MLLHTFPAEAELKICGDTVGVVSLLALVAASRCAADKWTCAVTIVEQQDIGDNIHQFAPPFFVRQSTIQQSDCPHEYERRWPRRAAVDDARREIRWARARSSHDATPRQPFGCGDLYMGTPPSVAALV